MAVLKFSVMMCVVCSCMAVTFPQNYERLYPFITQSFPQTLQQFLSDSEAREILPQHLTTIQHTPRDALDSTTKKTTTSRLESPSLPSKPELEPITQASFHPIIFRDPTISSSYSSIESKDSPASPSLSPLLTTLRPNDIPKHSEKVSPKSGLQRGSQSRGSHLHGDSSKSGQLKGSQFRSNKSKDDQPRGDLGTLFRSEVDHRTQQNFLQAQATFSRPAGRQQHQFQIASDQDASTQVQPNHEHAFSVVKHDESSGLQSKPGLSVQSNNADENPFNLVNNRPKLVGSASQQRTSRLSSGLSLQANKKDKKESRSNAVDTAVKLHQKRAFGASPKVFFEQPHHQGVFDDTHVGVGVASHSLGDPFLHSGGGIIGAPHHDVPHFSAPHIHGQDYHRPAKYDFQYVVKDEYGGNDFGHQESRSGHDTKGAYYVQLPDGRRQTVSYFVNKGSGFVAKVHYEGKAIHPQPKHSPHLYQSGVHAPVHPLETFEHLPQGHNLHSSFVHGGAGEAVFSLPTSSKFH